MSIINPDVEEIQEENNQLKTLTACVDRLQIQIANMNQEISVLNTAIKLLVNVKMPKEMDTDILPFDPYNIDKQTLIEWNKKVTEKHKNRHADSIEKLVMPKYEDELEYKQKTHDELTKDIFGDQLDLLLELIEQNRMKINVNLNESENR